MLDLVQHHARVKIEVPFSPELEIAARIYYLLVNFREVEHFMNKISRKPGSHALLSRVAQNSWIKLSKKAVTATKRNERKEDREEKRVERREKREERIEKRRAEREKRREERKE